MFNFSAMKHSCSVFQIRYNIFIIMINFRKLRTSSLISKLILVTPLSFLSSRTFNNVTRGVKEYIFPVFPLCFILII